MSGKKVAVLIPVSQEVAMTNAAALYEQLQQDLPTAISRAFDYAAIHGQDLASGGAGPFGDYLAATPHSVTLGSTAQGAGGIYADLVKGEQIITQTAGYELTGFAADPRLRPELKLATDTMGRPLFVSDPSAGTSGGTLIGSPAYYNPGVSGKLYRQSNAGGDSGLRAIGGDWSQCAWGQGMDLTIKVSTQANYVDSNGVWHSAFQENLVLLLAEAYYGFIVADTNAFVKYQGQIGS
jgi:HK97 family phage major capsid protein